MWNDVTETKAPKDRMLLCAVKPTDQFGIVKYLKHLEGKTKFLWHDGNTRWSQFPGTHWAEVPDWIK